MQFNGNFNIGDSNRHKCVIQADMEIITGITQEARKFEDISAHKNMAQKQRWSS